ncbi:orotate phosphoribosyltransferase [Lactobacillus terrae]|uniref:orotate phosphoribosyltransferase n=1 Tax=Lactobacillus terrae TaxID=2269374 RepID=UPI000C1B7CA5|nr:orotate phosphoribosyltransferase [Lactobacillus terrae]
MDDKKISMEIANDLLEIGAVSLNVQEPYTWASGIKSPIYTDNRMTIAYPEVRQKIVRYLSHKIFVRYSNIDVISGVATAGIPHATGVANNLNLVMNYVRSSAKDHGTKSLIEGRCESGDRIVIIDDLISTGGSLLKAVDNIKAEGGNVIGSAAIFSYSLEVGNKNFADKSLELVTLTNYQDLITVAEEKKLISSDDLYLLNEWQKNPYEWGQK